MIEVYSLHTGPSHNVYKIIFLLEELGVPYRLSTVNVFEGDQLKEPFLAISPNNKVPAIVDYDPCGGGAPISVFESGAIMVYLADKAGRFVPPTTDHRARSLVLSWTFWQASSVGPAIGQLAFFSFYARERLEPAIGRFANEMNRLIGVLDRRLSVSPWVGGNDYTIADIIIFSALHEYRTMPFNSSGFPNFVSWQQTVRDRPAYARAYLDNDHGKSMPMPKQTEALSDEKWNNLFNQTAKSLTSAKLTSVRDFQRGD